CYARLAMDLTKKRLGVLLSTGLEHPNLETAVALTQTALDRGADVYLYLIDEGVRALDDPRIRALPERGAKMFVCAYGCQKRGIPFHVEADSIPSDTDWNADRHEVIPITRERIAELVRQGRRFLAF